MGVMIMGSVVIGVAKMRKMRADAANNPTPLQVDVERLLTSGEIAMCQQIFKNAIDYSKVRIVRGGLLGLTALTGNAMTPEGFIHLPSNEYMNTPDFSIALDAIDKHWFIHEMTHVWQYQLGTNAVWHGINQLCKGGYTSTVRTADTPKNGDLKAYATDLSGADAKKKFSEFNFEQQGRIIEFWYDACYLQKENPQRPHHQRSLQLLIYVKQILVDFLQNPSDKNLLPKS